MAFTVPTVTDFITRFPIFADQDPGRIQMLINEAAGNVDATWREADYAPAIMYLAAHLLANDNSEEGADVEFGTGQSTAIASESFAGMSTTYRAPDAGSLGKSEQYGNTVYGRRYLALLRLNRPGVVVI